jgi:hypothetical protein
MNAKTAVPKLRCSAPPRSRRRYYNGAAQLQFLKSQDSATFEVSEEDGEEDHAPPHSPNTPGL